MPGVSRTDLEGLANHLSGARSFFGEFAVRLQYHLDGFLKVGPRFLKSGALCIGSRQFFDEPDVAFWHFSEHRREFKVHRTMIRPAADIAMSCDTLRLRRAGRRPSTEKAEP